MTKPVRTFIAATVAAATTVLLSVSAVAQSVPPSTPGPTKGMQKVYPPGPPPTGRPDTSKFVWPDCTHGCVMKNGKLYPAAPGELPAAASGVGRSETNLHTSPFSASAPIKGQ